MSVDYEPIVLCTQVSGPWFVTYFFKKCCEFVNAYEKEVKEVLSC